MRLAQRQPRTSERKNSLPVSVNVPVMNVGEMRVRVGRHVLMRTRVRLLTVPFEVVSSATPPATIATIPRNICRSTFSRKTTHAITAVKTPSRLSSRELVAAGGRANAEHQQRRSGDTARCNSAKKPGHL